MTATSLQQSTTPTILYESIAILDNPFSLPEYKAKEVKKTKKSSRDESQKHSPITILSILETDKFHTAYLSPNKHTPERRAMISSSGYSSSDRLSKDIVPKGNEDERLSEPITKYRKSCPSIAIDMKPIKHRKKHYRSRTPQHCIQNKNRDKRRKENNRLRMPRKPELIRTDTESGGPKPYFVQRKPINKGNCNVFVVKSEDECKQSSPLVHHTNTDGGYNNPFHPKNVRKNNAKYLSIVPKQYNNGNPFIDDDDADDGYSCYSEGTLYR